MRHAFILFMLLTASAAFAQTTSVIVNPPREGKYQKRLEYLMYNGDKVAIGDTLYLKDEYYGTIKNISRYVKSDALYYYAAVDNGKKTFSIDLTGELDSKNLSHHNYNSPVGEGFDMERTIAVTAAPKATVFKAMQTAVPNVFEEGFYSVQDEDEATGEMVVKGIVRMADKPASYLMEERRLKLMLRISARENKCRILITDVVFENRSPDHTSWTTFSYMDLFSQTEKGINTKWAKETMVDVNSALSKLAASLEKEMGRN